MTQFSDQPENLELVVLDISSFPLKIMFTVSDFSDHYLALILTYITGNLELFRKSSLIKYSVLDRRHQKYKRNKKTYKERHFYITETAKAAIESTLL